MRATTSAGSTWRASSTWPGQSASCGWSPRSYPANVAAHYYLGMAIRALAAHETAVVAAQALRVYLQRGAPIGREEEVTGILRALRTDC